MNNNIPVFIYLDFDSSSESDGDNLNDQEGRGGKVLEIFKKGLKKVKKFLKNPFGVGTVVSEEVFDEDGEKESQFWKKQPITDGYFTLETPKGAKVLTADSEGHLEIKGNFGQLGKIGKHLRSSQ